MKTYQDIVFEELREDDIAILTPIMKSDFDEGARIHLGEECGFHIVNIENPKDAREGSFILEMKMK